MTRSELADRIEKAEGRKPRVAMGSLTFGCITGGAIAALGMMVTDSFGLQMQATLMLGAAAIARAIERAAALRAQDASHD